MLRRDHPGHFEQAILEADTWLRAVTAAELDWLSGVIDDLRTGALTWSHEELAETATSFLEG